MRPYLKEKNKQTPEDLYGSYLSQCLFQIIEEIKSNENA